MILHAFTPPTQPLWLVGFVLSSVTAITFLAIGVTLAYRLRGLSIAGAVRTNPLAVGTALIFLTCGGGHLIHSAQMMYPSFSGSEFGLAARVHYMDWHLWLGDGLTAIAGSMYWLQRRRFPGMVRGAAMYEDLRARKDEAMAFNDAVVQDLNAARLAIYADDMDEAREAIATIKRRRP